METLKKRLEEQKTSSMDQSGLVRQGHAFRRLYLSAGVRIGQSGSREKRS